MPDNPKTKTPGGGVSEEDIDTVRLSPLGRAVRATQQDVRGATDRVEGLRVELGGRINQLDDKVDALTVSSARVEGQVGILVDELRAARTVRIAAVTAEIEIEKTGEIAALNEAVAVRADRRQLVLKVVTIAGSVAAALATLITLLAGRC